MPRLLPALLLAANLFAAPVYAQTATEPDPELAEFARFAQTLTIKQKTELLNELVQKTNAALAHESTEVFESIKISHRYPRSRSLDYTLTIRPQLAPAINIKRLQSPEGKARFQNLLQKAMGNACRDKLSRTLFEALGIREIRAAFTLNGRAINQSRMALSECNRFYPPIAN